MRTELQQRWIEALRSGEFQQVTGVLATDETTTYFDQHGFCCLGVAAHLINPKMTGEELIDFNVAEGPSWYPPLLKELGLMDHQETDCVSANDVEGKTFPQIADMIEEWFPA